MLPLLELQLADYKTLSNEKNFPLKIFLLVVLTGTLFALFLHRKVSHGGFLDVAYISEGTEVVVEGIGACFRSLSLSVMKQGNISNRHNR